MRKEKHEIPKYEHYDRIRRDFCFTMNEGTGPLTAGETSHRFLACGAKNYIVEEDGHISWTYPHNTRDGFVLDDGRLILTLSKSKSIQGARLLKYSSMVKRH